MERVIELAKATGADLDELGRRMNLDREAFETDSSYRNRLDIRNGERRSEQTPFSSMTLRDYFAAKSIDAATQAAVAYDKFNPNTVAEFAYNMADAMLRERAK